MARSGTASQGKLEVQFDGAVGEDGKLHLADRATFDGYLQRLRGKRINLHIAPHDGATISAAQRKFFHGVVCATLAKSQFQTIPEIKRALKEKFLADGEGGVRSTEQLSQEEMTDFIEQCIAWSAEWLGVVIEDPRP